MNKKQYINTLHEELEKRNIHYPKWELMSIIEPALQIIIDTLSHNEEVHLNKFGRFVIKHKKGSSYYNINTKQKETASDKRIVQFTPYKGFHFDDAPSDASNTSLGAPKPDPDANDNLMKE